MAPSSVGLLFLVGAMLRSESAFVDEGREEDNLVIESEEREAQPHRENESERGKLALLSRNQTEIQKRCCYGELVVPGTDDGLTVIISATEHDNPSWLVDQPYKAYIVSDFSAPSKRRHWGYEGGNYVRFILDHYEELPERMAFLHSHRSAWEVDDEAQILSSLDPESYGYMGLSNKWALDLREQHVAMVRIFFRDVVQDKELPPEGRFDYSFPSCGAFLVSADRVRRRSKEMWQRMFQWLQDNKSKESARIAEFSWHMLLGEPAEMKPASARKLCPTNPEACSRKPYEGWDPDLAPRVQWYNQHLREAEFS